MKVKVYEFEEEVWKLEGVRIVIRANSNENVQLYNFKRAAPQGNTVTWFLNTRVKPRLANNMEVFTIDGSGNVPNGKTLLSTLRQTYKPKEP